LGEQFTFVDNAPSQVHGWRGIGHNRSPSEASYCIPHRRRNEQPATVVRAEALERGRSLGLEDDDQGPQRVCEPGRCCGACRAVASPPRVGRHRVARAVSRNRRRPDLEMTCEPFRTPAFTGRRAKRSDQWAPRRSPASRTRSRGLRCAGAGGDPTLRAQCSCPRCSGRGCKRGPPTAECSRRQLTNRPARPF